MSTHNGDDRSHEIEPEQLTAYGLNQLTGEEHAAVKGQLDSDGEAQREADEIQALAAAVQSIRNPALPPKSSPELRALVEERLTEVESKESPATVVTPAKRGRSRRRLSIAGWLVAVLLLPAVQSRRESARRAQVTNNLRKLAIAGGSYHDTSQSQPSGTEFEYKVQVTPYRELSSATNHYSNQIATEVPSFGNRVGGAAIDREGRIYSEHNSGADAVLSKRTAEDVVGESIVTPGRFARSTNDETGFMRIAPRNAQGPPGEEYRDPLNPPSDEAAKARAFAAASARKATVAKKRAMPDLEFEWREDRLAIERGRVALKADGIFEEPDLAERGDKYGDRSFQERAIKGEQYVPIIENAFLSPLAQPLSTFSIDVDTASYANVRRFLSEGRLPPPNAVRIEELVNYFRYDYPQPKGNEPFSANMEVAECPWTLTPALSQGEREGSALTPALSQGEREKSRGHLLLRVGLKGKEVKKAERPQSNLVFLLDVSGSMADANKLPLLKTAMKLLVGELGENDRVSIVTYAGEAGLRLAPTRGHEQPKIMSVIDSLRSGGSTNGSAGIELAYEQAAAYFVPGGTNRVILCTDGDLNVGVTSDEALVQLIKRKATSGVFLTVLGFGEGNLKDAKMERLADNGNGLYAYIDSVREAKKVLVEQLTGSTITIAKDVKIQIEFNPAQIAAYRLLGYENRVLAAEDFNNDKKDAGEIGAGHTVTALYELVRVGAASEAVQPQAGTDPLKYQESGIRSQESGAGGIALRGVPSEAGKLSDAAKSGELLTLKLRYKEPDGETSKLLEYPLKDHGHSFHSASPDLQFAAAVASFGMILRGSEHRGSGNLAAVAEIASASLGNDPGGYRAEFVDLVRKAQTLGAR
jgi:secreted protein with Ig-like and vWFA domain